MDRKFIISQHRSPGHPLVWSSWKIFWLSSEGAEISWLPFRLLLPEARSLLLCCSPVPRLPARGLLLTSPSVLELCSAPQCSCTARFHYSFQQHGVFPDSLIDPSVIITNQLFPPAPCPLIECAMLSLYFWTCYGHVHVRGCFVHLLSHIQTCTCLKTWQSISKLLS